MEFFKMEAKGLRCDNPYCEYKDATVERKDYEKYINFPCPSCGASILTLEDYNALCTLEKLEKIWFFKFLSKIFPSKSTIEFHGHGFKDATIKGEKR